MKKFFLITLILGCCFNLFGWGSAYSVPNFVGPEYVTINSSQGILIENVSVFSYNSIKVVFKNANRCNEPEIATYAFQYYLSYRGQRVSDYFNAAVRCSRSESYTVNFWPDTIPAGNESYISVQFGSDSGSGYNSNSSDPIETRIPNISVTFGINGEWAFSFSSNGTFSSREWYGYHGLFDTRYIKEMSNYSGTYYITEKSNSGRKTIHLRYSNGKQKKATLRYKSTRAELYYESMTLDQMY